MLIFFFDLKVKWYRVVKHFEVSRKEKDTLQWSTLIFFKYIKIVLLLYKDNAIDLIRNRLGGKAPYTASFPNMGKNNPDGKES